MLSFLRRRKPDAQPKPDLDPVLQLLEKMDELNALVPKLPKGISLWIDYTPGPRRGTVILRKREFAEPVQIYPQPELDRASQLALIRSQQALVEITPAGKRRTGTGTTRKTPR